MSGRVRSLRNAVVLFVAMFITVFATLSIIDFLGYGTFAPYIAGVVGGVSGVVGGIISWRQSRESVESGSTKNGSLMESEKEDENS